MRNPKHFFSHWQNWIALILVGGFILLALTAPILAPVNEKSLNPGFKFAADPFGFLPHPPSALAVLGTVPTGAANRQIDIFYSLVWGTRSALQFGLTVALITTTFGVVVGAFSAYIGGLTNNVIMRITDAFLAFPIIVGVVFLQQLYLLMVQAGGGMFYKGGGQANPTMIIEPASNPSSIQLFLGKVDPVMLAIILLSWMISARITNTVVLQVKKADFVVASQALGASHPRIIFRHLIPNSISPAIILLARDIGGIVLLQAALTFIGIGGESLWGQTLVLGRRWIIGPGGNFLTYWWTYLPVTIAIVLFGVGWNLLGDGLNDWLNPRSAQQLDL
ncbi:MAG: putative Binding-protein-dependent transport system inner rane component [Chloroflexi bacterium]|nr:putative Binding-protein-dependent transport system inner rane component [Chloroflexota bacterium]